MQLIIYYSTSDISIIALYPYFKQLEIALRRTNIPVAVIQGIASVGAKLDPDTARILCFFG
jgi:hypothetical protein